MEPARKVAHLSRPEAYAARPARVDVLETHMSWVFLAGRLVYKLKKPVRHDVLDFSTLEKRCRFCEEEVRLNRRLAPDVYLGAVPLGVDEQGELKLEGAGRSVDWLVKMRRLPAACMLDVMLARGEAGPPELRRVGEVLGGFFAGQEPVMEDPGTLIRRLQAGVRADRLALCAPRYGLPRDLVETVADRQERFLEEHRDLLARRVHEGRIVEGHGDLRPEHVCLEREPVIIDCLEFSRELRLLDPADEMAFLALECERLGAGGQAAEVLEACRRVTGDPMPPALLRFYRRYRACRRAKLAVWHLEDAEVRDPGRWPRRGRRYMEIAARDVVPWLAPEEPAGDGLRAP